MTSTNATGGWLRPGVAAAIAAAGLLIPAGYSAVTDEASQHSPFGYLTAIFILMLVVVCLALAGLLGAAVVSGWRGTRPLLAGTLVGCVLVGLLMVAQGKSADPAEVIQLFMLCSVPLLVGYGIGRGFARVVR